MMQTMSSWTLDRIALASIFVLMSDQDYIGAIKKFKSGNFIVIISYMKSRTGPELPTIIKGMIWDDLVRVDLLNSNDSGDMLKERPPLHLREFYLLRISNFFVV